MTAIKIDLEISEATLRKIKAYAMLSGVNVENIEEVIAGLIDTSVSEQIALLLGIGIIPIRAQAPSMPVGGPVMDYQKPEWAPTAKPASIIEQQYTTPHAIADGLGDEANDVDDEEDENASTDPMMFVKRVTKSGASKSAGFDEDDEEMQGAYASIPDTGERAEDLFASTLGLPNPPVVKDTSDFVVPRGGKRVRNTKTRAKVTMGVGGDAY